MFSFLPFPEFILLGVIILVGAMYYAIKLRKSPDKSFFILMLVCILCDSLIIVYKGLSYWAPGTLLLSIFGVLLIIATIIFALTFMIIVIWRYRHGCVVKEKKKVFWAGISCLVFAVVLCIVVVVLLQI